MIRTAPLRALAALPLSWLHRLGTAVGWVVYRASPTYARRLRDNLRTSGVWADEADYRRLLHAAIGEAGKGAVELIKVWFAPVDKVAGLVVCKNWAEVERAQAEGRGLIFLTPHLGGFDASAFYAAQRLPLTVLYRPPRLRWLEPLMLQGRSRGMAQLAPATMRGVRTLYKALLKGEAVGLLPDQAPGAGEGAWASFFGRPAYTMTLVTRLQQATGAAVIMAVAERLPAGRGYELHLERLPTQALDERALNLAIENVVRRCPAQYLWSYNRYKVPAGAKPPPDPAARGKHDAAPGAGPARDGRMLTRLVLRLIWLLHFLPLAALAPLGRGFGLLVYAIARERRHVAHTNLRLCFPDWPEARRRRIARRHFQAFGRSLVERGILWWSSRERVMRCVRVEGEEHWRAVADRPVIWLAPHFVGLDMGGTRLAAEHRAVSVYSRQKNAAFDAVLYHGRTRFVMPELYSRQDGIRPVVKAMRRGLPFYYLPDMDLGPRDSIFVPFFGVPAATITGLTRIARLAGAAVVPAVTFQLPGSAGYVLRFYPAWDNFPSGDESADTRRMNAFIEERVLEQPEQYFWAHKRFKTRPPGEPKVY